MRLSCRLVCVGNDASLRRAVCGVGVESGKCDGPGMGEAKTGVWASRSMVNEDMFTNGVVVW